MSRQLHGGSVKADLIFAVNKTVQRKKERERKIDRYAERDRYGGRQRD